MVQGLTPTHDVPTGMERRMTLPMLKPLSGDFRVYLVNRKKGLRPGESMSDIAGHLATAIEADLGEPVFLTGTSTGGSVALQVDGAGGSQRPVGDPRRGGRLRRR
jgi:hypothetical protein